MLMYITIYVAALVWAHIDRLLKSFWKYTKEMYFFLVFAPIWHVKQVLGKIIFGNGLYFASGEINISTETAARATKNVKHLK